MSSIARTGGEVTGAGRDLHGTILRNGGGSGGGMEIGRVARLRHLLDRYRHSSGHHSMSWVAMCPAASIQRKVENLLTEQGTRKTRQI